jgi:hemerythrin superfamily protein
MNVLELLKQDHDNVKNLFEKFERTGKSSAERRSELFSQIRLELILHSRVEEEIFYPALKSHNGEGRKLVGEALREHKDIEELLRQLMHVQIQDPRFDDRFAALMEDVEEHVDQEEGQIFQFAKENCPEDQLEEMANEIEDRKRTLERQLAA